MEEVGAGLLELLFFLFCSRKVALESTSGVKRLRPPKQVGFE
jgi:hypothetical protein